MSRFSQPNAVSLDDGVQVKALVKWFNVTKGFGFVAPADGTPDAFLHISVLNRAGFQELTDGTEVLCTVSPGPKGPQVIRILEVSGEAPAFTGGFEAARGAGRDGGGEASRYGASCAPVGSLVELAGTVKWFKPDKGFGFVTADDGGKDVFVHKSLLRRCGIAQLDTGERVQMKVQEASKGREATWVTVLD